MQLYIQLSLVALLPVVASGFFVYLQKNSAFGRKSPLFQHLIIGLVFGLLSVCGTELGVLYDGVNINVRDAAPLCAGLIFGAPSGILAALIGGIERFIGVAWGLGTYTQIACTLATIFAGLIGALFHLFILEGKRASWMHGLAIGAVTEVFHMLMVFFTHMENVEYSYMIVHTCAAPMIVINAISVMLACQVASIVGNGLKRKSRVHRKSISSTLQKYLLIFVTAAFFVTTRFSWSVLQYLSESNTESIITLNLVDVKDDISGASRKAMLETAQSCAALVNVYPQNQYKTVISKLLRTYDLAEINIVDEQGIIIASSNEDYIGFDMHSGQQPLEFFEQMENGAVEYVQSYQSNSFGVSLKYAAHILETGGFVQIGYEIDKVRSKIMTDIAEISNNRHIMTTGIVLVADEKLNLLTDSLYYITETDPEKIREILQKIVSGEAFRLTRSDDLLPYPVYASYIQSEGLYLIGVVSQQEAMMSRNISGYINAFTMTLVFTAFFILLYLVVRRHILKNVERVNASLSEITKGNLDTTVDVRGNKEFSSMSDYINETVGALKGYIAEAASRLDKDLALAHQIQVSSLPGVFPPYPNRTEFDIFASMTPAKEVGGDFYDFYFLAENKLAFLIADVSGKGIPGAMFMMTAKTVLSNLAESGLSVEEVLAHANNKLCENNEAEMFVTCWMGILDTSTGKVEFANAGHNPPLLKRADGSWEYLKAKSGFVLAGMEDMVYRKMELELRPGDIIYLYTDGVTEATNSSQELYGEDRLLDCLNHISPRHTKQLCGLVKENLDAFVGDTDQFDDITMLALRYLGE